MFNKRLFYEPAFDDCRDCMDFSMDEWSCWGPDTMEAEDVLRWSMELFFVRGVFQS